LASLTTLERDVAADTHEISNPATWVLASLTTLERDVAAARAALDDPNLTEAERRRKLAAFIDALGSSVRDASSGMERVVGVTRDLRKFSRADSDGVEFVCLADVVRASCNLARPLLRLCSDVELAIEEGIGVRGRRGQLGQVVTNLLVNAAQAVAGVEANRRVRIELSVLAPHVTLAVDDSGPGVPPELRERIFEPFFTTKGVDEGTGLGLSVVAEIVRQHGGEVRVVESKLGGARFEVRLPRASE
jgi:signal transduction histidine kinase